jgi:hypothetical protein
LKLYKVRNVPGVNPNKFFAGDGGIRRSLTKAGFQGEAEVESYELTLVESYSFSHTIPAKRVKKVAE